MTRMTRILQVWVSDLGYTSESYSTALSASAQLAIFVVGINDSPIVSYPPNVLLFQKGIVCRTDYQVPRHPRPRSPSESCPIVAVRPRGPASPHPARVHGLGYGPGPRSKIKQMPFDQWSRLARLPQCLLASMHKRIQMHK